MTDTIDVAALPSPAEIKRMVAWLRTMNLGNGSATTDAIATALQSQAEAKADYNRILQAQAKKILEVTTRATTAEASLATMREALKPFAALGQYLIDQGFTTKPDDAEMWGFDGVCLTYGDFRRAALAKEGK